ncbi:MAG: hypothetical protein ACTHQM_04250 [Thermoanaerobaculia bacterium]
MIRTILCTIVAVAAGSLAVQFATPIDVALPLLCGAVALIATRDAQLLAVPLLIGAENVFVDERTRLLAMGVVVASSFGAAVWSAGASPAGSRAPRPRWLDGGEGAAGPADVDVSVPLAAILVLRWIPVPTLWPRELALIALALAIHFALHRTPFAALVAILTALVTPAIPLRTFGLPLAVLAIAALWRPKLQWKWASAVFLAFITLFFPWSGIMARAFPYFLRPVPDERPRDVLNYALKAGATTTLDVPPNAHALILSGANVAKLRRGAPLARIEPGGIDVRIGDVSDWGYMRRDHFYGTHNPLPRDVAGAIRGWGYDAWIDGAGRIALPENARTITIVADKSLPADAALQVDAFELQ